MQRLVPLSMTLEERFGEEKTKLLLVLLFAPCRGFRSLSRGGLAENVFASHCAALDPAFFPPPGRAVNQSLHWPLSWEQMTG